MNVLTATSLLPAVSFASPAGVVPGFGNGAAVIYPGAVFYASARQSDGKLLVTGNSNGAMITARYNRNGSLDSSFNKNGVVLTDFLYEGLGYNSGSNSYTIAVQKDGKIIVAGLNGREAGVYYYLVMARYNTNGSLDSSFDGDGKIGPSSGYFGAAFNIALQSDQKILISGSSGTLLRFNTDGSRDVTFDQSYESNASFINTRITAIAVQADDKILELRSDGNFIVLRYNADGTRDNNFNGTGLVYTDFGGTDNALSMAVQPDGKLVVSGDTRSASNSQRQIAIARYNPDGSLDQGFDGDGKATTDFGTSLAPPYYGALHDGDVSIQNNGKIVSAIGNIIARFNSNGSLDHNFYHDGENVLDPGVTIFSSLIIDNNLYVSGQSANGGYLYALTLDTAATTGLSYRYYEGEWNSLPDFNTLVPVKTGMSSNADISVRPAGKNDHFAFVWEGFINIQTPGTYNFETVSDDGSKFYFNTFYSAGAAALVNNDGIHAAKSATGSVNITAAGLYPVTITYFEKDGGESMQLYWAGPGITRQLIPDAAFVPRTIDVTAPQAPTNLRLVYKGRKFVHLDWENATDNVGVATYRVYANGYRAYTTTQSFVTADGLFANSGYTFAVTALDAAGNESAASNAITFTTVGTGLDYKFYSNVPFGLVGLEGLNVASSGASSNIDISIRPGIDENYAFLWQGYINIPTPGTYTFETVSDDGSRIYFNTPYSDIAEPLVNNFSNNGLHAPESVSRTINIPSAGLYPIAVTYHQYGGGQSMQLYWQGPGFSRQLVPDAAFTDDSRPNSLTNGVNYKYYEGNWSALPDFSALTPVKTGQSANIDLGVRPAGRNDNFAFVWEGYITIPTAGDYAFETISDDGSKLYFNSKYIPTAIATVNNDGIHAATPATAIVHVSVAGSYPISVSFFEATGEEKMEVYWSGPGISRQLIPTEVLSPNPSSQIERLSYKYYQGAWTSLPDFSTLSTVKTGTSANVDITVRPSQWNDIFAFVWQGYINIPAPGTYNFETISDDGSKLYFNNFYMPGAVATVNNDGVHAAKSASGNVYIANAGVYPIAVTYFEQYGGQSMELYWSGPGITRQRIPNDAFTLVDPSALTPLLNFKNLATQKTGTLSQTVLAEAVTNSSSVYPNPFDQSISIDFYNAASANDISIGLFDLNGRKILMHHPGKLPVGNNIINMNLNGINIGDGVYIIQVQKNGIPWKTMKVVKMKR